MSRSTELEKKWRAMTPDERLLAYARAKLEDARHRDSIPRFKHEHNESNFWYDAMVEYAYGSGKR